MFITILTILLAKDSFIGREYKIYQLLQKYPWLTRITAARQWNVLN